MRRHSSQLAKDHGEMIRTHAGFSGESGERVAGCEVVIERFSRAIDPARIPLELRRPVQASFPADDVEHTLWSSSPARRSMATRLWLPAGEPPMPPQVLATVGQSLLREQAHVAKGRGNERNSISTCQARRNR